MPDLTATPPALSHRLLTARLEALGTVEIMRSLPDEQLPVKELSDTCLTFVGRVFDLAQEGVLPLGPACQLLEAIAADGGRL